MTLRAAALAAVVALHLAFGWLLFRPRAIEQDAVPVAQNVREREEVVDPATAAPVESDRELDTEYRAPAREPFPPSPPAATPEEQRAYERGVEYELQRQAAVARFHRSQYGEHVAALMHLPVAEAWPALEKLAEDGDPLAAEALLDLSGCDTDLAHRTWAYTRIRDDAVAGLAPVDAAFVRGALDTELLGIDADAQSCAAAGLGVHRLVALAQRRLAKLGVDTPPPASREPLAWRRYFERAFPAEPPGIDPRLSQEARAWVERLDAAGGLSADAWAELERVAEREPALAMQIAYCVLSQCEDVPREAQATSVRWIERAATLGLTQAVNYVIEQRAASGDAVEAHAWAEFGMWVIASGCFPMAQAVEYAALARQRLALASRMTAAQFATARARLAMLMRQHGEAALDAQGCTP